MIPMACLPGHRRTGRVSFKADVDFHARLNSFQRIAKQWTGYQKRNAVKA
jgi:hypothetical protein